MVGRCHCHAAVFQRASVSNAAIPIKAKNLSLVTEILTRLAASCCDVFKQDRLFKDVAFSDLSGTELENEGVQLGNLQIHLGSQG